MDNMIRTGEVASWLHEMEVALDGADSNVPCGDCSACCTSSQFVHIEAHETDTLEHIPAAILFPAPGADDGTMVIGYDRRGHCPMLVDGLCSIYEHRPRTCRVYDCRAFAVTGVTPDKPDIAAQARRWVFEGEGVESEAVRAAAAYLAETRGDLGPTQTAVSAIKIRHLFLGGAPTLDEVEQALQPR